MITSDGDRVLQVVGNLISNAFQATPDGGTVSLELAQSERLGAVAVEDSGPGIPAEKRERLFRPFISETGGGTGLGLAIAKELSTALGGRTRAQLRGREGLPLRARAAGVAARRSRGAARRSTGSCLQRGLDPVEPRVHRAPALGEQVEQEREIVEAGVPLGLERRLDAGEPADRVVREALHLGDAADERRRLLAQPVAECFAKVSSMEPTLASASDGGTTSSTTTCRAS